MSYRELIVAQTASGGLSVRIPVHANVEGLTQTYTELRAQTLYRYLDGGAAVRRGWSGKLRTEVQGRGLVPAGLAQICNATGTVSISCVGHRSVRSAARAITIPAARRTDLTVVSVTGAVATGQSWYAREWNGDTWTKATGTATGNVVTLATGATGCSYEVVYFPKLTGYAELQSDDYTQNQGFGWSLVVEEA